MFSYETKLAVIVSHWNTMIEAAWFEKPIRILRDSVIWNVEDYLAYPEDLPHEPGAFRPEKVLSELRSVPDDEGGHKVFVDLLQEIGFRYQESHCWIMSDDEQAVQSQDEIYEGWQEEFRQRPEQALPKDDAKVSSH